MVDELCPVSFTSIFTYKNVTRCLSCHIGRRCSRAANTITNNTTSSFKGQQLQLRLHDIEQGAIEGGARSHQNTKRSSSHDDDIPELTVFSAGENAESANISDICLIFLRNKAMPVLMISWVKKLRHCTYWSRKMVTGLFPLTGCWSSLRPANRFHRNK